MQMNYLAVAESLNHRRLVKDTEDILNLVQKRPNKELFTSLYTYEDKHLEHFKKTNSLSGITGIKTNRLFFDFDSEGDVSKAQADALKVCNRLIEKGIPEHKVQIYFSGNKGFHINVNLKETLTRQEFVNIVFNLAEDCSTFDEKINDEARIIRVPFSKHMKSGLHKIPIEMNDLKNSSVDTIKEYAKDITPYDINDFKNIEPISLTESLNVLKFKEYKKIGTSVIEEIKGFNLEDIDFTKCPKWISKERYALQEGFFYGSESIGKGERNTAFMILAATYKAQGLSKDHALAMLLVTSEKQAKRTGEEAWDENKIQTEVITPVFSPNWKGGIYSSEEPLLQITRKRFNLEEPNYDQSVEQITDVANGFKAFAQNMQKNRVLVGLESLDKKLVLTTGMVCTVVSAPGGGKTALANLFAETVSKGNENVLYFSLDLFKNLLFGRMLQRHISYDIQTIFSQFENNEVDNELLEAYADVLKDYSNVGFSFKTSSIEDIEQEIKINTELKGKTPKLIVVDYLDKVRSPYTDPTQSSAYVVGRLSDIAKKYSTLVLLLAQPSKFGSSGPEQEFKSYRSLKGSSSIESDSRVVLGLHRPGYSPSDQSRDLYSSITILKNNTGSLGRLDYAWDGLSGTFSELTGDQRKALNNLRAELESSKLSEYDI